MSEAREAGLATHRLRTGSFAHLYRGVYQDAAAHASLLERCQGLSAVLPPDARFSHATAARLYGAPLPRTGDEIHVTVSARTVTPRRRAGLRTHARLQDDEPQLVQGLLTSSPEQTFLDLAQTLRLDDLIVLGDYLVRHWTTPTALHAHLAAAPKRTRGLVRAREALGFVRERVDSPQETRLRLHIVRAGLPEPEVNVHVFDDCGGWLGQPDLAHRKERIATQFDGDVHRTNRRRWQQDIARDESFRDADWVVLRATGADVDRPGRFLQRLSRHLTDRAA